MDASTILLIVGLAVLAVLVFLFCSDFIDDFRVKSLFKRENCSPTHRIGKLWIDENNRKWTSSNLDRLFDFRAILDYDLQSDGESLKKRQEFLSMGLDPCSELAADRCRTFERLVVVVILRDSDLSCVNIPVGKTKSELGSAEFKRQFKLAEKMCNELERIKNIK